MKNQNKKDANVQNEKMNKTRNEYSATESADKSNKAQNCRNSQNK